MNTDASIVKHRGFSTIGIPKRRNLGEGSWGFTRILDDCELYFSEEMLENIRKFYNEGHPIEKISNYLRRDADEIFLAIFHLARKGKIKLPFAYRKR